MATANLQKSTSNFLSPVLSWNFHFQGGGGDWVGVGVGDGQFSKANFKFSKSSPEPWTKIFIFGWRGGGGLVMANFQLLMLSLNLLKSKKKFTRGFAEKFLSFRAKKCLGQPGNGFGLWVPSGSPASKNMRIWDFVNFGHTMKNEDPPPPPPSLQAYCSLVICCRDYTVHRFVVVVTFGQRAWYQALWTQTNSQELVCQSWRFRVLFLHEPSVHWTSRLLGPVVREKLWSKGKGRHQIQN